MSVDPVGAIVIAGRHVVMEIVLVVGPVEIVDLRQPQARIVRRALAANTPSVNRLLQYKQHRRKRGCLVPADRSCRHSCRHRSPHGKNPSLKQMLLPEQTRKQPLLSRKQRNN